MKVKNENQAVRKESELECFKRIKVSEINLSLSVFPEKLNNTLTNPNSLVIHKATARILLNPLVQKTISELKTKYGEELVENILKANVSNIQKNINQRMNKSKGRKAKESDSESEVEEEVEATKTSKPSKVKSETNGTTGKAKKKSTKGPIKETKKVAKVEAVDSFFVTSKGEGYTTVTAALPSSDDEEMETDKPQTNKKEDKKSKNLKPAPMVQKSEIAKISKPEMKAAGDDAELHPSWKAKAQMRKAQIQDFQGTKIKFDD